MTSHDRRRRELARIRFERQQQRRADRERQRRRRQQILVGAVVATLVLGMAVGLILALATGPDDTDDAAALATPTTPTPGAGTCTYLDATTEPALVTDVGRPPEEPGDLGPLSAVVTLDGSSVTIELDTDGAPCTANSWQFLADNDFYDDTVCHRLTTSETLGVLQCGDPSGTGRGGPGYRYAEENLDGATYPAGTVAMANTGAAASTGSQFFVVHSDSVLPPDYTVVGSVVEGIDAVEAVAEAGTVEGTTDGAPAADAVIDDLVVERSPA
jgi:peptidyl-prolyl cis-trans isomerase B (cyclophilin B)